MDILKNLDLSLIVGGGYLIFVKYGAEKGKVLFSMLFRNVCPPVSYTEKVLYITFCEFFNEKNKYEN